MDCLRLNLPLSGSTETDTCEDFSISIPKVKNAKNLFLWFINLCSACSILSIIILCYGQYFYCIYLIFSYHSSNQVCMLQGVSKFIKDFSFRFPLACSLNFIPMYSKQSTVCSKLFATCVFSIGAGVFGQSMTILKWENTAAKWLKVEVGGPKLWDRRKKLVLKNDVSSKKY